MNLSKKINKDTFLKTYYLKKELIQFCKANHLPTSLSKQELTKNISDFLEGKEISLQKKEKRIPRGSNIRIEKGLIIDKSYSNDVAHRAFFLKEIGKHFKYNVPFIKWMKENKGKSTYQEAIDEWKRIVDLKKTGFKFEIGSQFEYNTYTRSFFKANPNLTKEDCIKCWNHKKKNLGNHKYEKEDLQILKSK
jgi:hypothetical protein